MLKKYGLRKIGITTLLLLLAFIMYHYPTQINDNINSVIKNNVDVVVQKEDYLSMITVNCKNNDVSTKIETIIEQLKKNHLLDSNLKILSYDLKEGLLKIDFNRSFYQMEDENKTMEALVFSLTRVPEIDRIMIFVDGVKLNELPNSHTPLDLYLDKSYGINKIYDIHSIHDIDQVTLYFYDSNHDMVPVTYYYNQNNQDKIKVIIKELKSHEYLSYPLSNFLNNNLELMNYEIKDQKILLDFNEFLLVDGLLTEDTKYSIAYSIMDSIDVKEVEFTINSAEISEIILAKSV